MVLTLAMRSYLQRRGSGQRRGGFESMSIDLDADDESDWFVDNE